MCLAINLSKTFWFLRDQLNTSSYNWLCELLSIFQPLVSSALICIKPGNHSQSFWFLKFVSESFQYFVIFFALFAFCYLYLLPLLKKYPFQFSISHFSNTKFYLIAYTYCLNMVSVIDRKFNNCIYFYMYS